MTDRPTFAYPFAGDYPVSSPYGPRGGGMHTGTDFAVPHGVPILAAQTGYVKYAAYEAGGAGNTVTVEDEAGSGWQSRYHHMVEFVVWTGQHVDVGQTVGYCDSTGSSTGSHLHFEIRSDSGAVTHDPVPILEDDAGQAPGPTPIDDAIGDDDVMLIIDKDNPASIALLFGNLAPRKLPSVNDYQRGTFVLLDHDAFEAAFAQQLEVYQAATR